MYAPAGAVFPRVQVSPGRLEIVEVETAQRTDRACLRCWQSGYTRLRLRDQAFFESLLRMVAGHREQYLDGWFRSRSSGELSQLYQAFARTSTMFSRHPIDKAPAGNHFERPIRAAREACVREWRPAFEYL